MTRLAQRLLDGERSWGSLEVWPSRYGLSRCRLIVFPPGISREERIVLRFHRSRAGWALAAWLILEIALMPVVGSVAALVISSTTCLCAVLAARAMAGPTRNGVRTMTVVRASGVEDGDTADRHAQLSAWASALCDADVRRASGTLTDAAHEAVVWRVYDQMPG